MSLSRPTSLRLRFRRAGRALAPGLGALVLALSACTFKPHIPDQAISCATDQDCPQGFACNTKLTRCCRPGACDDAPGPAPARPPAEPAAPSSNADAHGARPDGGVDQALPVPSGTPPAADAGDGRDGRDARGDGGTAPPASLIQPADRPRRLNSITEFGKKREDAPAAAAPHLFAQLRPPTI